MTRGSISARVAGSVPTLEMGVAVVCGALVGFGAAIISMSFSVSFSVCDLPTTTISIGLSFLLSVLFFAGIVLVGDLSPIISSVICLCLPALDCFCLKRCSAHLVDNLEFILVTLPVKGESFSWRIILPSLVFGFAVGLLRQGAVFLPVASANYSANLPALILAGVFTVVALWMATVTQRNTKNFVFRTLCPLIAVLLAAYTLGAADMSEFGSMFVLFSGYLALEACLLIAYADISQRYRISPFVVYGFGRGSLTLGSFVAFLMMFPNTVTGTALSDTTILVVAVLMCIIVGVYLMPTGPEIRSTLIRGTYCPAFAADEVLEDGQSLAQAVTTIQETLEEGEGKGAEGRLPDEELRVREGVTDSTLQPETLQSTPANKNVASDVSSSQKNRCSNQNANLGKFKRKCLAVADCYLLSERESEILFLLAKGWNAAAIQEHLFISSGTVNTHMRHIYRKINVHSQQELISVIDSVELAEG